MNIGSIGSFAGGLAGGYHTQQKSQRDDRLADADINYKTEHTKLAVAQTEAANADTEFYKDLGAELRNSGFGILGAGIDGGPRDPKQYAQWMLTRRQPAQRQPPDNQPSPTLTQPGGQPIYGSPFGA